ncbi:MAG: ABC transporter permease [Acidimicrobiia bacterium]
MDRSGGRSAARMWAGADVRHRRLALVALGLIAGITAGLATAAFAGARRTDTAWDRLRDATQASDAIVFTSQAGIYTDDELGYEAFAELPYVERVGAFGLFYASSELGEASGFLSSFGDWLDGVDTPRIVEGRAPRRDAPDEVVISRPSAGSLLAGFGPGDVVRMHLLTQEQLLAERADEPEGPEVKFEIVGVMDSPFNLAAIPSDGDIYVGPAFRERYGAGLAVFSNLMVKLKDPARDLPRLEAEVARRYPGRGVPVYDLTAAGKRVTHATDLERSGLQLFALAVVLAGLVILGQTLTRSVRAAGDDVPTLAALGFSRSDRALALALPHVVSVMVAAAVTVVVAIVLSERFPIGLGRRIDPDLGWHVDLPVIVAGAALTVIVLGAAVAWSAWRAAHTVVDETAPNRAGISSRVAQLGLPVTVSTGIGLALDPGRGQRALPTRPAVIGAIVGVLGVIGALTLAAGISDATTHPERFGAVWDVEAYVANAVTDDFRAAPERMAEVRGVDDVARVARVSLPVGDIVTPFYGVDDVKGSVQFVLLDGRAPARGEVALGPDSADAFGVSIGDDVEIGSGGRFRVVGLVLLPTTPHSSFDQGGWMLPEDLARATPDGQRAALGEELGLEARPTQQELEELLFDMGGIVARFADDAPVAATTARVERAVGPDVVIESSSGPADQQNLRNTRPLPLMFALFAGALAIGALLHVSATVLRRRRHDLAVLRVLGLTTRQARACLAWQATTLAAIGLLVGVPLGVIVGRLVWRAVADQTPMVYVPPTALPALLLAVPLAFVVANLLAALPGSRAARLRPAEVLRAE